MRLPFKHTMPSLSKIKNIITKIMIQKACITQNGHWKGRKTHSTETGHMYFFWVKIGINK